jgi:glutathione synthase/RimK-type ligase-like ATP-grasp enzyme
MEIYILTDYNGNFGSKWKAEPYRSGYDKSYLQQLFEMEDIQVKYMPLSKVDVAHPQWKDRYVLYTSSEEVGFYYKQYVEDVIFALHLAGAKLIPNAFLLRANNNKVFMELFRQCKLPDNLQTIKATTYGSFEELQWDIDENNIKLPCVVKKSAGAMSRGVFLARNLNELKKYARIVSKSGTLLNKTKEFLRQYKNKGYQVETYYQNKFIIQPFIPNLSNDWKILIYYDHYYILKRHTKPGDFRASGSGVNYLLGTKAEFPMEQLNLVESFFKAMNVANLSIDFAFDGKKGYILEYQAIHYGTSTQFKNVEYFEKIDGKWIAKPKTADQEQEYVYSITQFVKSENV